jgi:hypothetical protein
MNDALLISSGYYDGAVFAPRKEATEINGGIIGVVEKQEPVLVQAGQP